MPSIRRRGVPKALLEHLWRRIDEREISIATVGAFRHMAGRRAECSRRQMVQALSGDDRVR